MFAFTYSLFNHFLQVANEIWCQTVLKISLPKYQISSGSFTKQPNHEQGCAQKCFPPNVDLPKHSHSLL